MRWATLVERLARIASIVPAVAAALTVAISSAIPAHAIEERLSPQLRARLGGEPAGAVDVIVWLRDQPARRIAREAREAQADWRRLVQRGVEGALQSGDEAARRAWRQIQKSLRRDVIHHTLGEARRLTRHDRWRLALLIRALGGTPRRGFTSVNAIAATIPAAAIPLVARDPGVVRIGTNERLRVQLDVSAPALGAPTVWGAGFTGGTADVALFDSGVDRTHPAFAGLGIVDHVSLADVAPGCTGDNPASADDLLGHGTAVAGVLTSRDGAFRGVAPGIERLYNVKIVCQTVEGDALASLADAIDAADWLLAQPDPPEVVNASLGIPAAGDDSDIARFVDAFMEVFDTSITIAAGNTDSGSPTVLDPGIAWNVITVMNMDDRGTAARADDLASPTSNRGPTPGGRRKPDLGAPGTNITTTLAFWEVAPHFIPLTGTSLAAPHVAGAAALLAHAGVESALERKALLINTAEDRGPGGWDQMHGWGYVDLAAAFAARARTLAGELTAAGTPTGHRFYRGSMPTGGRATLTWNRHITDEAGHAFNDLNLELFDEAANSPIAASTSTLDNVEQVRWGGSAAQKILKVSTVTAPLNDVTSEPYALAVPADDWVEVAPPALTITGANGVAIVDRIYLLTMTVRNTGGLRAYGVEVTLTLPGNVTLVAGANPASLPTLDAGAQAQVIWMLRPTSTAGSPVTLDVAAKTASFGETYAGAGSVRLVLTLPNLDADGNGTADLVDARIILRYLAGLPDPQLLTGIALGQGATRNTAADIRGYLDSARALSPTMLDADGDREFRALTDGRLIYRFLAGATGEALVGGNVLGPGATRTTAEAIASYLQGFLPAAPPGLSPRLAAE